MPKRRKDDAQRNAGASSSYSRNGRGLSSSPTPPESPRLIDTSRTSSGHPQELRKNDLDVGSVTPYQSDTRKHGRHTIRSQSLQGPWTSSWLVLFITTVAAVLCYLIVGSFMTKQLDIKGCRQCYMYPVYNKMDGFDTEHTALASKYSLYLYREGSFQDDGKLRGTPVLFIPGNAGSYRQVRSLAAESAYYHAEQSQQQPEAFANGVGSLDWFSLDFNEDFTAFHGQTLLDQAEYANEAIAYILSLYHDPSRAQREPGLPEPASVIIVGHSMGGVVGRTMMNMTNYQQNSINTIITMATPHARAPIAFDAQMVEIYDRVNDFWRTSYDKPRIAENPLWPVTLVSLAGGTLDTTVPSDYASIASLVPASNGFTAFTTSLPGGWTGADHLAILWCDQIRKAVVRAISEAVFVKRADQVKHRAERMRIFKKWFLTGLEDNVEKQLTPQLSSSEIFVNRSDIILTQDHQWIYRDIGVLGERQVVIPMKPLADRSGKRFTLLTNQPFSAANPLGRIDLEILFCKLGSYLAPEDTTTSSEGEVVDHKLDLIRMNCKNAAADAIQLPGSTPSSILPTDENSQPLHYHEYESMSISKYQFIVIVDKGLKNANEPPSWLIAQYQDEKLASTVTDIGLPQLLRHGLSFAVPRATSASQSPAMVYNVHIPAIYSSLLAFRFRLTDGPYEKCRKRQQNDDGHVPSPLFEPFLRQHISEPYESKFFVNVQAEKVVELSMHGLAPYMPPLMGGKAATNGFNLQLWTDPSPVQCVGQLGPSTAPDTYIMRIELDILGSLGKLVMRYRTAIPAIPLIIVAIVLRKQFIMHDRTGVFISFTSSLDLCLRSSLPVLITGLTILATSFATFDYTTNIVSSPLNNMVTTATSTIGAWTALVTGSTQEKVASGLSTATGQVASGINNATSLIDYSRNDLLLGNADPLFWFLMPMFTFGCIAIIVLLHYALLSVINVCSTLYYAGGYALQRIRTASGVPSSQSTGSAASSSTNDDPYSFPSSSPARRLVVTSVLLVIVATLVPYQFAYVVACIVQLTTATRAFIHASSSRKNSIPAKLSQVADSKGSLHGTSTAMPYRTQPGVVRHNNFFNYAHSILLLMITILPINMPVLVVWVHNLAVQWLTPFSSHHNVLSVMPFILLVETMTGGKMIPRIPRAGQMITSGLLFGLAVYAGVKGVSYAYALHHIVNALCTWFVALHFVVKEKGNWTEFLGGETEEEISAKEMDSTRRIEGKKKP